MPITEYCNPDVVCCEANASIAEVAALMRKHHIDAAPYRPRLPGKEQSD